MNLSYQIRKKIIAASGYWIYRKAHLPVGTDFFEDVTAKLNISPRTIFDVGANYGQTALSYAENFPGARIYSFEPVKKSFEILAKQTKNNPKIESYHCALGEETKTIEISVFDDDHSQLNSLKAENSSQSANAAKEIISILALDDFSSKHQINAIDLLKIDTEGYEVEVLKGAAASLKANKIKMILCEVALTFANQRNSQLVDVINHLKPYNYTLFGLYETNINHWREGKAYSNALFVKT